MTIHNMTFMYFSDEKLIRNPTHKRDASGALIRPYVIVEPGEKVVGVHESLKNHLESTEDIFLWTYSIDQKPSFDLMVKKHQLDRFIVFHSPMVTNPNYQQRRVAMCIMKGKKSEQAQADAGV